MSEQKRSFTKRAGAFASATVLSRILGFIRDSMVAAYFGGGMQTDAFYAAFKVPNLLRRFLGEGSMTSAFVPVFTDVLNKEGEEEARHFLNALFSGLVILLAAIVILGLIFARQITWLVAWGFATDPEKFRLTTELTRLILPFLMVISLAALATAVLNSRGRFFVPALAPSGLSIGEIAFIVFIASRMESPIYGLAVAAVAGVGIHLVWQLPYVYKEGFRVRFVTPFKHPKVKTVFMLMVPTIIGLSADQINSFVDQFCASFLPDGSITALYNSNRIMQMPLAIFGVAVASVALPAMSKAAANGDDKEFKDNLSFSIRIANFILIPSFIGLSVLGLPISQALFQHGKFTIEYSRLTYLALVPYAAGLPAYSTAKIFATAFYARKDTQTPMRIAFWCMAVNCVGDYVLMWKWGVGGLAFATTAAAWFQSVFLFLYLRKSIGLIGGRGIVKSFLFGCAAGAVMGGVCAFLAFFALAHAHIVIRVFISVSAGIGFYFLAAKMLDIEEYRFFMDMIFRKRAAA